MRDMNNERRIEIQYIIGDLEQAKVAIEQLYESELEAFNNLPQGLKNSNKGVYYDLDDAINLISEVINFLSSAKE